jgi:hypothetical protein
VPAQFTSKTQAAIDASFASDTVTITRQSKVGPPFTTETIYGPGAGDLQETNGSMYYSPDGAIEQVDAVLVLSFPKPFILDESNEDDTDQNDVVPQVQAGDTVTRASDQRTYTVVTTALRIWQLYHLEIKLQRGGLKKRQP